MCSLKFSVSRHVRRFERSMDDLMVHMFPDALNFVILDGATTKSGVIRKPLHLRHKSDSGHSVKLEEICQAVDIVKQNIWIELRGTVLPYKMESEEFNFPTEGTFYGCVDPDMTDELIGKDIASKRIQAMKRPEPGP